ncbi:MAG: rubrerythrin family protein [Armatimonadetes bacterium]|nr:rubrerythrin family protein [Armatimonadota bacterium]
MRKMTDKNLRDAFAGESQAHMRYLIFADQAEADGKPNIARLFRAIAYAEQVHATNHFKALGDLAATPDNLQAAIDGETYEVDEMYPAFDAVAKLQGEREAQKSIHYAISAERIHAGLYSNARELALKEEDFGDDPVVICAVCGYTAIGATPEKCPVCSATREQFRVF